MSDDWIEESALRFEGFDDAEIAQIKAAIPKVQSLVAFALKNEQVLDTVKSLLPTLDMVLTKLKARMT